MAIRLAAYNGDNIVRRLELESRTIDIDFDWLSRRYTIDIAATSTKIIWFIKMGRSVFAPLATLEEAGDLLTLNIE